MTTSSPDNSAHGVASQDLPHPDPAPDVSQDEVTPASLSQELSGFSPSLYSEPPSRYLEQISSSVEDENYQAPERAARIKRRLEGQMRHMRAVLPMPQVDELGIIPELLEDPGDSPVSASEPIKGPDIAKLSLEASTSDLMANDFSRRTGPRHSNIFPQSSDQVSVASWQTFETALSSIGSYTTASSGPRVISHFGQWTASNTEAWISHSNMPWTIAINNSEVNLSEWVSCEPLVSSIESLHGKLDLDARDALRKELLPLCDPSWNSSTSVKSSFTGLVSRIEQIYSSYPVYRMEQNGRFRIVPLDKKVFAEKAEQLILKYAATQPHLQHFVRVILPIYEPFGSQWLQLLQAHNLILDPKEALDWSGRGQHVEYSLQEQESIPLVSKGHLGYGASGIVDRVRCRRIDLARKTIRCIRQLTRGEAAKEVRHLQQLQHRHIVRLVGTYMLKKNLSILMYPATEYSLDGFLDYLHDGLHDCFSNSPRKFRAKHLWGRCGTRLFACLVNAIAFIHAENTKHMDIKPRNILVDYHGDLNMAKVYITDFGIARSYQSKEESFTDSPISYTRIYTAPEVAQQAIRGPPADIFSLGCVFMEILATLLCTEENCQQEQLRKIREGGTDNSYQANVENIVRWYESQKSLLTARLELVIQDTSRESGSDSDPGWICLLPTMLAVSPEERPSAAGLKEHTHHLACGSCDAGPEPFKAAT
jgi:serine/threonine protein kinase